MVRQALLVISISLSLGLSLLWVLAFSNRQPHAKEFSIPLVYVNAAQTVLITKGGIMYCSGLPFSGWQYTLYENGDTALVVPFLKGKEQGMVRRWHANGLLSEQRFYENGNKTGEHKAWWENGNPRFLYHFENDLHEGNQKEWAVSGFLYKNSNYKNGKENGLQQLWRDDGSVIANYEVKNGRNYGLTGVKNCKSVWEDEKKN